MLRDRTDVALATFIIFVAFGCGALLLIQDIQSQESPNRQFEYAAGTFPSKDYDKLTIWMNNRAAEGYHFKAIERSSYHRVTVIMQMPL